MQAMREYEKDRLSMSHSLGLGGIISDIRIISDIGVMTDLA